MKNNKQTLLSKIMGFYRILLLLFLCILILCFILSGVVKCKENSVSYMKLAEIQLQSRINHAISLLESLCEDEKIGNTELPLAERGRELKKYSIHFGYWVMGVTDEKINTYSSNGKEGNLAKREFMQKLYAGEGIQITDVYSAGEDGASFIYTIAVPIEQNGDVVSSIWLSPSYEELEKIVLEQTKENGYDLVLFGQSGRIVCSSVAGTYDKKLPQLNQNAIFIGKKGRQTEADLKAGKAGSYWEVGAGKVSYVAYQPVTGTPWTIMYRGNILRELVKNADGFLPVLFLTVGIGMAIGFFMKKSMCKEMKSVQYAISTVQNMQKQVQVKEENVDYRNVLDISVLGLVDSLTGIATRAVFVQQIEMRLSLSDPAKTSVLCFVDLDDLKQLNDNYGHGCGDEALKNIACVLRKYEKMYDGMAARYGGDEFLIFLPNFLDECECEKIIKKMVEELAMDIRFANADIRIHCSVGTAMYVKDEDTVKELIGKADNALYRAKHHGKNTYSIYKTQRKDR